jgi:hypothetical protein
MNNLDAFVGLLLFLAGAPAFVLQFSSNTARDILLKRKFLIGILTLYGPFIIGVILFIFFNSLPATPLYEKILLYILIALMLWVCFRTLSYARSSSIVRSELQRALHYITHTQEFPKDTINNIMDIGHESSNNEELELILTALKQILNTYLQSPTYKGNQFEEFIKDLEKIFNSSGFEINAENYQIVIKMMQSIVEYPQIYPGHSYADQSLAYKALSTLGQQTLDFANPHVTILCMNALNSQNPKLSTTASQSLYEIAAAALKKDKPLIAMNALQAIGTAFYAFAPDLPSQEIIFDYLALLAAFWQHGHSGQFIAQRDLNELRTYPGLSLEQQIEQAIEHQREKTNFGISDQIEAMWQAYHSKIHFNATR